MKTRVAPIADLSVPPAKYDFASTRRTFLVLQHCQRGGLELRHLGRTAIIFRPTTSCRPSYRGSVGRANQARWMSERVKGGQSSKTTMQPAARRFANHLRHLLPRERVGRLSVSFDCFHGRQGRDAAYNAPQELTFDDAVLLAKWSAIRRLGGIQRAAFALGLRLATCCSISTEHCR